MDDQSTTTKYCPDCQQDLPREAFCRDRHAPDGLAYRCRCCRSLKHREWATRNKERIAALHHEWAKKNAAHLTIYRKNRLDANPDLRKRHRDNRTEKRAANPEEARRRDREYYAANAGKMRELDRAYYRKKADDPGWRQAEWLRLNDRNRRRYELTATITDETKDYLAIIADDPCVYCGGPADTIEHITPISKGGTHEWENLDRACMTCNLSRGNRPLAVFLTKSWD